MRRLQLHILIIAVLLGAGSQLTHAQLSPVSTPESISDGQSANLFLSWQSDDPVDGFYVELPDDWQLTTVQVSEIIGAVPLRSSIQAAETSDRSAYRVAVDTLVAGSYQTIFRVRAGEQMGRASWTITPFVEVEDRDSLLTSREYSEDLDVEQSFLFDEQYALTFDGRVGERPGLNVDGRTFGLAIDQSFTVEFWMKSVQVNEVVVSTWDGRERSAYPMEIMIDPHGYLNCYRRSNGLHHSLMSSRPLADGKWHHVALTHEIGSGWSRLVVDGQTTDSLHVSSEPAADESKPLILGGRPDPPYAAKESDSLSVNYTGAIDEFRVWPRARVPSEIRQSMHRQIDAEEDGVLRLGFDDLDEDRRFTQGQERMRFIRSELSLFDPIEQLRAERRTGGVEVTWEARPSFSKAFVVERSTDGHYFEQVSRVPADDPEQADARRSRQYSITDPTIHEGVVYYRVRQVVSEEERQPMAKTIKVGLRSPRTQTADLVGNFPNPFNSSTVIKYELHETQHVRLEVWDLSGHQRAVLVNKTQEAGPYDVRFESTNLPSGAYVIRLETERATQTHTMILMK